MSIAFASSPRSTLGIEWELGLVDRGSRELVGIAPELLAELSQRYPGDRFPHLASELLENTVELVTAPHGRVVDALGDLRSLARAVQAAAEQRGAALIGSGSHPFSRWKDQTTTPSERYERFMERYRWWGRNMLIWGVHVHVGVDRQERVVPIMNALLVRLPHLLALSASSPLWAGESTGYASNRTLMFQQLSTAGLPWDVSDWAELEHVLDDLATTGIIAEPTEARWDIRPAPRWGTLELRACDGASTLREIGALAALSQCLVESFQTRLDRGEDLPRLQPWFVRENKWRAARYGLDATVIVDREGRQRPLREDLAELLAGLAGVADRLGCTEELGDARQLLTEGTSAERQLAVYESAGRNRQALHAVVDSLVDEFQLGLS
ncbi:glutamate--cysteine ligase [Leucobacter weissii]|uniref:Putative glutamate--cysteine ligase 2 n=1 Tax=Leucobacter weissii TaxID=1983706 RepID=A0A939MJG0_9MICO|nr:glutamate--cysteine ligase [Leucobacter weissii]MBO1902084.1 glutamate--cysteine ligase [Leucobacter weissii]